MGNSFFCDGGSGVCYGGCGGGGGGGSGVCYGGCGGGGGCLGGGRG